MFPSSIEWKLGNLKFIYKNPNIARDNTAFIR